MASFLSDSTEITAFKNLTRRPPKEPKNLEDYLATEYIKVDFEVKQKFLHIVATRNYTKESDVEKNTEEDFLIFKKARINESQELNNQLENFTNLTEKKQEYDR
ncbi:4942_t:CDS:2, partial [Cetraspora pellucida]